MAEFISYPAVISCPRCRLETALCLCADIPRVPTKARIVILRHAIESRRVYNSGRIAALALPNSEIVDHGEKGSPATEIDATGAWLLYPGGDPPRGVPERLVVLDGTWREARRMFIRIPALRKLPRLSLTPPASAGPRLRRPPSKDGMATLEAIAHAVGALEGAETAKPLHRLWSLFVERSITPDRRAVRKITGF
jgi:DTW domain-containing protein